jgi:hypothetical protein
MPMDDDALSLWIHGVTKRRRASIKRQKGDARSAENRKVDR